MATGGPVGGDEIGALPPMGSLPPLSGSAGYDYKPGRISAALNPEPAERPLGARGCPTPAPRPGAGAGMAGEAAAGGNAPVGSLAEHLHVLAGADYHLDIRFTGPAEPIVGLGAVTGEYAAVVIDLGAGQLELLTCDATQVAPALLGLLSPIQPGRGVPVNIPTDLLDHATTTPTATYGP
jgi:hypothetical protein